MHKLRVPMVPIPDIWVVDNKADAEECVRLGWPFVYTELDDNDIVKFVMWRTLSVKFPYIDWEKHFGVSTYKAPIVYVPGNKDEPACNEVNASISCCHTADIATDERWFNGKGEEACGEVNIVRFVGDMSAYVSIEILQDMQLLPAFMSDIADNIRKNLFGSYWNEGYNKKLGVPLGNFSAEPEAMNLLIIDVSGSIPEGVSATMLALADTMRHNMSADLIITGSTSKLYMLNEKLPSASRIRSAIGYGNESTEFVNCLSKLDGRHYANVISFGDNDCPALFNHSIYRTRADYHRCVNDETKNGADMFYGSAPSILVDHTFHYHTSYERKTGYAIWTQELGGCTDHHYCTEWCKVMR